MSAYLKYSKSISPNDENKMVLELEFHTDSKLYTVVTEVDYWQYTRNDSVRYFTLRGMTIELLSKVPSDYHKIIKKHYDILADPSELQSNHCWE